MPTATLSPPPRRKPGPRTSDKTLSMLVAIREALDDHNRLPAGATHEIARRFDVQRQTVCTIACRWREQGVLPPVRRVKDGRPACLDELRDRLKGQADEAGEYPAALLESTGKAMGLSMGRLRTLIGRLRVDGELPARDPHARHKALCRRLAEAVRPYLTERGQISRSDLIRCAARAGVSQNVDGLRHLMRDARRLGYLPAITRPEPKPPARREPSPRPVPSKRLAVVAEDDGSQFGPGPLVIPPDLQPNVLGRKTVDGPWRQTERGVACLDPQRPSGVALWLAEWRRGWDVALAGYLRDHLTESGADAEDDAA